MRKIDWTIIVSFLSAFVFALSVFADPPQTVNYQGYLKNTDGTPVNAATNLTFSIYSSTSGAGAVWSEQKSITPANGIYSTRLGTVTPLTLGFGRQLYLGVKVASDPEMRPLQPLASVPSAYWAAVADSLSNNSIGTGAIVDGSVTAAKLDTAYVKSAGDTMTGSLNISSGNLYLPTSSATEGLIYSGGSPFIHSFGTYNFFAGSGSGNLTMAGSYNSAIGAGALAADTTGSFNAASGLAALMGNTKGDRNTASGAQALKSNTEGNRNTALGFLAGDTLTTANANTTGSDNTFIGAFSGPGTPTQLTNATAIGANALVSASNSLVLGGTGVNVGIGTTAPTERLEVIGTVKAANFNGDGFGLSNVSAASIVDNSITTPKIIDGAVTDAKISGPISGNKLGTHTHSGVDITSGSINNAFFSAYSNMTVEGYLGNSKDVDLLTRTQADARFVNEGQANSISSSMIAVPINLTGSASVAGVISGSNFAQTGYGLYGVASGTSGRAVYGAATATGLASGAGGFFSAAGDSGTGVAAFATGASGLGVYGYSAGASGRGVYGYAGATGAVSNYGGYFSAAGNSGRGVYSEASGNAGVGIYGRATGTGAAINFGGRFQADGNSGTGVFGYASVNGAVTNYGGDFLASGDSGVGVKGQGGSTGGYFLGSVAVRGEGVGIDFYAQGAGVNYVPFTGSHEVMLSEEILEIIKPGMIVSVTGKIQVRKRNDGSISLSSTLPMVKLSKTANDKAVFGVFIQEAPLPEGHWYEKWEGKRFAIVNALGEGRVLVTNLNGNIELGDYITTSNISGYGQKQDDSILRNYTLGKAIETVDWDMLTESVEYGGKSYKVYLIGVVYTSG